MSKGNEDLPAETRIWQVLTDGTPVVITTHVEPDADGLGSALGLWHALGEAGAECHQIYPPPLPAEFRFLPGVEDARYSVDGLPAGFNLVVMDCGSFQRLGDLAGGLRRAEVVINIDHHATNRSFGDLRLVEEDASSCGELVYRMLESAGRAVSRAAAECLYCAILSDTGKFSYHNTSAETFRVCHRLVGAGADPHELAEKLCLCPTEAEVRLQALAIETLKFEADGRIGLMRITDEMCSRVGIDPVDCHGFADVPTSVRGVEVGVLLKEMPRHGYVDVSLRSRDRVDVCEIAEEFGGGGHRHAAGCELRTTLDDAEGRLVKTIRAHLTPTSP